MSLFDTFLSTHLPFLYGLLSEWPFMWKTGKLVSRDLVLYYWFKSRWNKSQNLRKSFLKMTMNIIVENINGRISLTYNFIELL